MIKIHSIFILAIILLTMVLATQTASASIPTGGTLAQGTNSTNATPSSSGSINAAGGYVTEINISTSNQQTTNWQAFWGNITGGKIYLNDSSGNSMYNWNLDVSNNGFVYATTKTTAPAWSNVTSIPAATLDGATYWNLAGKSDSIAITYPTTANIIVAGYPVTGAINTTVNTNFKDYAISDASAGTKTKVIWVAEINDNKTNFKSTSSDYEMLVPVNAGDVYYFFTEIL